MTVLEEFSKRYIFDSQKQTYGGSLNSLCKALLVYCLLLVEKYSIYTRGHPIYPEKYLLRQIDIEVPHLQGSQLLKGSSWCYSLRTPQWVLHTRQEMLTLLEHLIPLLFCKGVCGFQAFVPFVFVLSFSFVFLDYAILISHMGILHWS